VPKITKLRLHYFVEVIQRKLVASFFPDTVYVQLYVVQFTAFSAYACF